MSESGSSVGAELEHVALETSVDADLEDDEYIEQVTDRVFSPPMDGTCTCIVHGMYVVA